MTAFATATDGVDRLLAISCMLAVRMKRRRGGAGDIEIYAPHGFDDLEQMIVRPNNGFQLDAKSYEAKAERWQKVWPELKVLGL